MTGPTRDRTGKRTAGAAAAAAVLLLGGYLAVRWWTGRPSETASEQPAAVIAAPRDPGDDSSGMGRLRDGARQVSEPAAALDAARQALARVEAEQAAATDDADRVRLARKRRLILEALERLEETTQP